MRYFYYVHTGHRIGLDRFHRAVAIVKELQKEIDITLLCSDFRIAAEAKEFGIKRSVGVDVVRNIPQIAEHGDKMIFDSAEANPILLDDMTKFFSTFIRISDDPEESKHENEFLISPYLEGEGICKGVVIGEHYFDPIPKTIPLTLFFGDDDYEKDLEKNKHIFKSLNAELLMGFYHFLGYEKKLSESFTAIHDAEEYENIIRKSNVLITSSPQAVLQNLAAGGKPIYLQRPDYSKDFIPFFRNLSIPIVENFSSETLVQGVAEAKSHNYHEIQKSNMKVIDFIRKTFNL
ncbi:MAG: hypothetical protein CJD30_02300 [Sulfuricurvum sp. PD_MW2]|uniref:hypothetical protein n=1 Tax=Sulfuricurvum sp. PD_MW2 TaxID=2027917 RepID=UPI000C060ADE|nr:hypothetical protein [Sulfuricurvum sp. PD_MW2]PHM18282.1 MAG: hypothetical protein CJD30_02300 [Sulfuricurvum sp. PD_MW2]